MAAIASASTDVYHRYHDTPAAYVLPRPNDAIEQDRLDVQAAAIVEMIGGFPLLAPVQNMTRISKAVDIGCGTGVATMQIAALFPFASVYGLDLSPVPEAAEQMAPENVTWVQGNALDVDPSKLGTGVVRREIFTASGVDYVFGRMLFLGINDWSKYFSVTAFALSSGGIIEHQDLDWKFYRAGTSKCLSDNWEWYQKIVSGAKKLGLSTSAGTKAASLMEKAGLQIMSVQTFEFSFVPSKKTPNSQAMGRYVQAKLIPQYPELLRKMLGAHGIVGRELERLTKQCLHDISSEAGIHQKYTVTIARKP